MLKRVQHDIMTDISLKALLEAGCHFGHKASRWYPTAKTYIYTEKDGVHIIDLALTKAGLERAGQYLLELAQSGSKVLFVGAKRQAEAVVEEAAKRCGAYFVTKRWPGGLLTNFSVMKKNLARIEETKTRSNDVSYTKKERLLAKRDHDKLIVEYGGMQGMDVLPEAIFVVDVKKFEGAIKEAQKMGVKIIAICDTNADPNLVDFAIPANDDAVGSVKIIVGYLADCYAEGKTVIPAEEPESIK